ncbi:hypothetical protein H4R99_002646 [Coemansia sp. RSA 1722]|nr:hypothetical protein LPJ57_001878 [Coemansia sp. RSA 486]KAJ2602552.1 hypothetical protein H4R99_002646 [Coemansia sp. RSA 1722]
MLLVRIRLLRPNLPLVVGRTYCSPTIPQSPPPALCSRPQPQRRLWTQTRRKGVSNAFVSLISAGSFPPVRSYIGFRPPPSSSNRGNGLFGPPDPLWWVKPAAYTAGGVALTIFAWPLLRFVVIGGLAYGAYRLARVWWALRELNRGIGEYPGSFARTGRGARQQQGFIGSLLGSAFGNMFSFMGAQASPKSVRTMGRVAETSIRAALRGQNSHRIMGVFAEAVGGSVDAADLRDAIELGKPMETQLQTVNVDGKQKSYLEAVFPLYVDDAATTLFAHVTAFSDDTAADSSNVIVDSVVLLARMSSGQVAELGIDVNEQDDSGEDSGNNGSGNAFGEKSQRKVQDAEYKDV